MYKLMIVEDEPELRAHVRSSIDYTLDLALVAEAGDADIAIETAIMLQPQIVVMDIGLPGQDGLSLAEMLIENNKDVQIIILSGFQDFEYAKKALSIGVVSYLTKPLDPKELNKALKSIIDGFQTRKKEQQLYAFTQLFEENRDLLQQWQIQSLLQEENIDVEESRKQMELLDMELSGEHYSVLVVSVCENNLNAINGGFHTATVKQHLETKFQEMGFQIYSYFDDAKVLHCIISWDQLAPEETIESIAIILHNERFMYFNQQLYIGISDVVNCISKISLCAKQAQSALQHCLLLNERVISWHNIKDTQLILLDALTMERLTSRLIECIRESQEDSLSALIEQIFEKLTTIMELREFSVEFLGLISKHCSTLGIYLWNTLDYPGTLRQLFTATSTNEFKMIMLDLCFQLHLIMNEKNMDSNRYLIAKAKEYIDCNYANPALSLEQVGNYVGLSKSYLCSLFHKVEKKTFKIYLMELRVHHAKRLLTTTEKKIFEISDEVGCNDAAYFNRIFKRISGMTPLQYRNSKK